MSEKSGNTPKKFDDDKFIGPNETNPFADMFQKYGINSNENLSMEDLFNTNEKKHSPLSMVNEKENESNKKEKGNENIDR